ITYWRAPSGAWKQATRLCSVKSIGCAIWRVHYTKVRPKQAKSSDMGTRENWMDLEQRLFYTNCTKLEKKIQTDTGITVLSLDFPTTTIPENIPRRVYVFEDMVKERGCAKNRVTESEWLKENPHWKGAVLTTLKDIGHGYLWDRHWNEFVYVPLQRAFFFVTSRKPPPIGNGVSFWLNANVCDFDERSGL
ncbi:hypothetical protein ACROYT_G029294, partial [Oculina patagonica]